MLFLVYFCWNTVCNGIYVHPVSLHCMDLPSVISFIIKFTAQSSWVVLVGLVASSLLDVFFINFVVRKLDSAVQKLMKRGQSKWRVWREEVQKTLVQLLHGCIYLTLQTMNEKHTKHQSAFFILLLRFKCYLPFF